MTALRQDLGMCPSFSYDVSGGTTVHSTLTSSQLPGQGDEAFKAVILTQG
jgi:hypothetical protein